MVSVRSLLLLLPSALLAAAATHNVDVGKSGLSFSPDTITAAPGDTVNFHFYPGDHGVSQSVYGHPCQDSGAKAIWSGFINPSSGVASKMFSVKIKNKLPIWLYCPQIGHCQDGMAMVINPASGQSVANYQLRAKSAPSSNHAAKVQGGKVVPNKGS